MKKYNFSNGLIVGFIFGILLTLLIGGSIYMVDMSEKPKVVTVYQSERLVYPDDEPVYSMACFKATNGKIYRIRFK